MSQKRKECQHYWVINSNNVGVCRYCRAVKNFEKLQRRSERKAMLVTKAALGRQANIRSNKKGRQAKYA